MFSNRVRYRIELMVFLITRNWIPENNPCMPYFSRIAFICDQRDPCIYTPLWSLVLTVSKGVVMAEIRLPPIAAGMTLA